MSIMRIHASKFTEEMRQMAIQGFREYSIDKLGINGIDEPIAFYISDEKDNIVAMVALFGLWKAMHIKYLWVHKEYRNNGYGTSLMNCALDFAKKEGYLFACLKTMNFHAPEFYKKLGFYEEFRRQGYCNGDVCHYFRKDL